VLPGRRLGEERTALDEDRVSRQRDVREALDRSARPADDEFFDPFGGAATEDEAAFAARLVAVAGGRRASMRLGLAGAIVRTVVRGKSAWSGDSSQAKSLTSPLQSSPSGCR
jgi:hypothetical protein